MYMIPGNLAHRAMAARTWRGGRLLLVAFGLASCLAEPLRGQDGPWDLLVSSRNTNSVKRYDGATGVYVDDFVVAGAGGLNSTQEIRLAPDGDLIVSGRGNSAILRFDSRTGAYKGRFTSGYSLSEPTKMTWGPDGNLYVSQWGSARENVAVFGPDGAFIREATPHLVDPMQHAWDADGNLLVVFWGSKDVRRFDSEGNQLGILVSDSRLQGPTNLRWDLDGYLQVFDWQSGAVYRYDGTTGEYVDTFISGIRSPEGWTIGPDGDLYICEWNGNVVSRFDPATGASLGQFTQGGGLQAPNSVLFLPRPSIFELEPSTDRTEVARGSSTTFSVRVSGVRDVPFNSPVELECSSASAAVQCAVSPSSVTPGANSATATVTVTAAAAGESAVLWWALPCSVLVALLSAAGRRRHLVLVALAGLLMAVSCGGGGTGAVTPDNGTSFSTLVHIQGTVDDLVDVATVRVTVGG